MRGPSKTDLRRLQDDLGEIIASHGRNRDADYSRYADDPVGFALEVLGVERLAEYQVEIMRSIVDYPLSTVRSCHAAGKDFTAGVLSLWWAFARRGLVILTGPTAVQVEEILMRNEVRSLFDAGGLPGDLHVRALRTERHGRIIARTGGSVNAMTGFHAERVLYVVTEAQDPEIEHAWDAGFACTTGEDDRFLTLLNPTELGGRAERAHHTDSNWHRIRVDASRIPNVAEGRQVIPGLLSRSAVEMMVAEYGAESPFVQARVHAEFPSESLDGVFSRAWLEQAANAWESGRFSTDKHPPIVAVDPAGLGRDATAVAVRRGPVLQRIVTWRKADTMKTVDRVVRILNEEDVFTRGSRQYYSGPTVVVDRIGLGAGVADRLRQMGYDVEDWNGGSPPRRPTDKERHANVRAASHWHLRRLLEAGEIALPRSKALFDQLVAIQYGVTAAGKVQIEAKLGLKGRLGGSPDEADAVIMAFGIDTAFAGPVEVIRNPTWV